MVACPLFVPAPTTSSLPWDWDTQHLLEPSRGRRNSLYFSRERVSWPPDLSSKKRESHICPLMEQLEAVLQLYESAIQVRQRRRTAARLSMTPLFPPRVTYKRGTRAQPGDIADALTRCGQGWAWAVPRGKVVLWG